MGKSRRICLVVDYYLPRIGGGEVYVSGLAEELVRRGHSCVVVTSRFNRNLPISERINGVRVVRVSLPGDSRLWFLLFSLPVIVREARKSDLVQGAGYGGALPSFLGAFFARKPCCLIVYEFMGGLWRNLGVNQVKAVFYQITEKLIVSLPVEYFLALSRYTRNCLRFLGVSDKKLEVAYGGMDETLRQKKDCLIKRPKKDFPEDCFVFLCYGRAGVSKGIELFAQAAFFILQKVPKARFIFIATREHPRIWQKLLLALRRLPKETYQFFPGQVREKVLEWIRQTNCVVVPSLSEGFGFAALEACFLGQGVVATDAGSLPEVICGKHILVKPGSVKALVDGCIKATRGEWQQSPWKEFSWSQTASVVERVYQEVLEKWK
ncbi:MAG: glycosyltransferase family 4 protein [Candidatus Omnitrophica bacterium]|nr:glycosyltransferase family 4 protein [Candidatus Omnitrophota bacterium]